MSSDFALSVQSALIDFLAPLREAAADPKLLVNWLAGLGHTPDVSGDPALLQITQLAESIAQKIEAVDSKSLDSWDGIGDLLDDGREITNVVAQLRTFAQDPSRSQFASGLADEVIASLLATYLRRKHATAFRVGAALDVVRPHEHAAQEPAIVQNAVALRYPRALDAFNFGSVSQLLSDPGATLSALYLPNQMASATDAVSAAQRLFPVLSLLADQLGLSWHAEQVPVVAPPPPPPPDQEPLDAQLAVFDVGLGDDPLPPEPDPLSPGFFSSTYPTFRVILAQSGSNVLALELRASSAQHAGAVPGYVLALTGSISDVVSHDQWQLTMSAQGQIPALSITPNGVDLMPGGLAVAGGEAHVRLDRVLPAGAPPGPVVVLGNAQGTRLELGSVSVDAGLHFDPSRKALSLSFGAAKSAIVIAGGDGDGFISEIIPKDGVRASFDLGLEWASDTGLTLRGSAGLDTTIPVGVSLGPILLSALHLGLQAKLDSGVTAEVSANIAASIGPVHAVVERLGLTAALTFPSSGGNLGVADLSLGFKSPTGIGLSIDAQGVLTGGGFVQFDPARGMYAGVLQLSFHDKITLTAYGIITTKMPDGSRGYSLLIFITADGFKPIPLGFGFMLQSIGGMVGVNRTFDENVLKAGLKTDSLSTLLFPRDPVGNAPALIQALASAFPASKGSYLIGLLARITWFTPTLVQFDLALILEFGARTRLLMLGRVAALLPSRDNDLIRINLDVMGVLDFDAGTLAADAVLVDSRLVHQFPITGSAALRARWSGDANFVLAVGGFNPRFAVPAGFPTLERVTIALCSGSNPRLVCDAYFAITANTVQFGARASLYAEAAGFSIAGDIGFDALVTLLPPHFIIDFHASMQLKRGSHNLFKLTIDGTLEGPLPLRVAAKAKFEILWFSFTVHFDFTLTAGDVAQAAIPAVSLITELTKALADPASWTTRLAAGVAHGVALRPLAATAGSGAVLDPLGQLVVQQQVVPLNTTRDITTFGGAPVTGDPRFHVTATLNGQAGTSVSGAFAPARYFTMSDDDKLVAPSFETMDAGLVVGDPTTSYDPAAIAPADLTYFPITLAPLAASGSQTASLAPRALPPTTPPRYTLPLDALTRQRPTGAAARVPVRRVGRARFRTPIATPPATVAPPQWRIVRVSDGLVATLDPNVSTWSEYRDALATLNRGGATWQMVPAHEIASTT